MRLNSICEIQVLSLMCDWFQIMKLRNKIKQFTSLGMKLGQTPFHKGEHSNVITSPLKGELELEPLPFCTLYELEWN